MKTGVVAERGKRAVAEIAHCPYCQAPRNGDSLVKHCWNKHRSRLIVVTGPSLIATGKAADVLRSSGFTVLFPSNS